MYLLDTNICIYAIKGTYPKLNEKLLSVFPDQIKISAITISELEYGASKSKWGEKTRLTMRRFLSCYDALPFNAQDALAFGNVRALLESKGTTIGPFDAMIGSQGVARGITVVTHNTKEFCRIPGIMLEDWAE